MTDCFIHKGPIEDGTILAIAHGQMYVDFFAAFGVSFGQGGKAAGVLVDELILKVDLAVQDVLYELAWFILKD